MEKSKATVSFKPNDMSTKGEKRPFSSPSPFAQAARPSQVQQKQPSMSSDSAQGVSEASPKKSPSNSTSAEESQEQLDRKLSASSQQTNNSKTATASQQTVEAKDLKAAKHFSFVMRQQLDPAQKDAAKKLVQREDPADRLVVDMLQTARKDMKHMVKMIDIAQHDAFVQIQEQREQTKYYKKFKKPKLNESYIDPEFGCTETFPEEDSNEDKSETILLLAQETALIRETARRFRQQARELAKRRIRSSSENN